MASNDVVLSAASRSNLLSLQKTQRSIDNTQLRLATGKKVNSALDNPQSFFTANTLSNRASDLSRLLDGIGQSINSIKEADKGVTAITDLVTQAQSIASSARDELAASSGSARLVGNVDLRTYSDITAAGTPFNAAGVGAGDVIRIATVGDNGSQITNSVTLTTGDTAYTLAAKITNAFENNNAGEIVAKITDQGYLSIESKDGRTFRIGDAATGTQLTTAGYTALGLRGFEAETRGTGTALAGQTVNAGNTVKSISLYESTGNVADAGDIVSAGTGYTNAAGTLVIGNLSTSDTVNFVVNNSATIVSGSITLNATTTFQDVVDQINATSAINTYVKAGFDSKTGQITLTSLSDTVKDLKLNFGSASASATKVFNLGLGDPTGLLDPLTTSQTAQYQTSISFQSSTSKLDGYTTDYNNVRTQIDSLVKDANYRGINLLGGDNLTTFFNEDNSSKLTTLGANFTSDGLGLTVANFTSSTAIELSATQSKVALDTIRAFGSSLSNNLAIIQTRQTFTQETVNTLKAGAADLVNADLNEEGANLLALQTAQQLGVTSLSLASQSQQSVLRLF